MNLHSSRIPTIRKVIPYLMGRITTQVMIVTTVPNMTMAAKMIHGRRKFLRFLTAPHTRRPARIPPNISPNRARTNT